jgi:hypothetical protein
MAQAASRGFNLRSDRLRFVVGKVAVGRAFLLIL